MRPMLQLGISVLISGIFSLLLVVDHALALPATPPSLNLSSVQSSPSFLSFPPTESQVAACDDHMGVVNYDDCDAAIALFPRDPRGRPVLRNFYTDPPDESSTMPNVRLPLEQTYGSCTAQVLLATNFNDVPHDQSSWNNLIGPLRIVLRQCARIKGTGGVIVRNGNHQNLEAVLYGADSVYSKVHILRNSDDPLAVSIAQQELLALLGLAPNVYINPSQAGLTALKGQTFNASVASPLANSQPSSTTVGNQPQPWGD